MYEHGHPIVVAFDGSDEAQAAVTAAVALFSDRPLLIVSVWEPGLAIAAAQPYPDTLGATRPLPSPDQIATVDEAQREHATATAMAGAELARSHGATVEALPVADSADVARTLGALAEEREAAAVVVGSRGLGAVKSKILGSTSRALLQDSRRPVLVVRAPG